MPGMGVLDITTEPQGHRTIGELVTVPLVEGLTQALSGFENHGGGTVLAPTRHLSGASSPASVMAPPGTPARRCRLRRCRPGVNHRHLHARTGAGA